MIIGVSMYSPADEAGLREKDVIIKINGREVRRMKDLLTELAKSSIGAGTELTILRRGEQMVASLRLVEMPRRLLGR